MPPPDEPDGAPAGERAADPPLRAAMVIGAGLMGSQIGLEYALAGCSVTFVVRDATRAAERLRAAASVAERAGLLGPGFDQVSERLRFAAAPEEAGGAVDIVVENLPEDRDLKVEMLGRAARAQPEAVIASNTSSFGITDLARASGAAERMVGTHYWNPPLLMPLVELVAGADTDPAVLERAGAWLARVGKRAVRVGDVPGFAWNRLQLALLREALWLVENGVADAAGVDAIVRDGLARRWSSTGPFETVALGGVATFDAIAANLFPVLSDAHDCGGFGEHVPVDAAALRRARERRDAALTLELRRDLGGLER